jgi:hypothetical protein
MAELALTVFKTSPRPRFRVARLGDKWPTTDFYCELIGGRKGIPAALFQIKTPLNGLAQGQTALHVHLSKRDVVRLSRHPLPAYLLGVCHKTQRVFARAIPKTRKQGIVTIPVTHELLEPNVQVLRDEIAAYWSSHVPANINSNFP